MIYKTIDLSQESAIQNVFRHIANDVDRTAEGWGEGIKKPKFEVR